MFPLHPSSIRFLSLLNLSFKSTAHPEFYIATACFIPQLFSSLHFCLSPKEMTNQKQLSGQVYQKKKQADACGMVQWIEHFILHLKKVLSLPLTFFSFHSAEQDILS